MRALRPGAHRSTRRAAYRERYERHMNSARWRRRRTRWLATERSLRGREPVCAACGTPWTLRDDLHHATYERLGAERHDDMVPMCRTCHEALHLILERSRSWLALPRPVATWGIIARLRATLPPAAAGNPGARTDCSTTVTCPAHPARGSTGHGRQQ